MDLPTAHRQNQPLLASLGCHSCGGGSTRAQRLACLRALPAAAVARALPKAWTIPGMDGLPLSPAGQGYYGGVGVGVGVEGPPPLSSIGLIENLLLLSIQPSIHIGVPVVDGLVLAMPVLDALKKGIVDVPVIIGAHFSALSLSLPAFLSPSLSLSPDTHRRLCSHVHTHSPTHPPTHLPT